MPEQQDHGVRVTSWGSGKVTIEGLSPEEIERIRGVISLGQCWMKTDSVNGVRRPIFHSAFEPLPPPIPDSDLLPFWDNSNDGKASLKSFCFGDQDVNHTSPAIYISYLCGYFYTPEKYQKNATRLESFGFSQMRSKRGDDGLYWEVWYLPGLWAARGALRDVLEAVQEKPVSVHLDAAVNHLRHQVSFGSLDVVVQRCAMVVPE